MSVDDFLEHWRETGGSELANTQSFINGLCGILGVDPPHGSRTDDAFNDYVSSAGFSKTMAMAPKALAASTLTSAATSFWRQSKAQKPIARPMPKGEPTWTSSGRLPRSA